MKNKKHEKELANELSEVKDSEAKLVPRLEDDSEVTVLKVDKMERYENKSIEPHVKELLEDKVIAADTEEDWGDEGQSVVFRKSWLLYIMGIVVLCSVGVWGYIQVVQVTAPVEVTKPLSEKKRVDVTQKDVDSDLDEINQAITGYLGAGSIEAKLKFVRHPERVEPLLRDHYRKVDLVVATYEGLKNVGAITMDEVPFVYVSVRLTNGGRADLLLEQLGDGSYKVDWESNVCYLPFSWGDFVKQGHEKAFDMRVFVEVANVYLYEFSDEERYQCFRVSTRDSEEFVYAYAEKGSEVEKSIHQMMWRARSTSGGELQAMILKLSIKQGRAFTPVAFIDTFIEPRWMYVKNPEEE